MYYLGQGIRIWKCEMSFVVEFHVKDIRVILPTWTDIEQGTAEQQEAWRRMVDALREHEMGHVEIVRKFAGETMAEVVGYGCTKDEAHEDAIRRAYEKWNVLHDQRHAWIEGLGEQYDVETGHGATQGVDLPQI